MNATDMNSHLHGNRGLSYNPQSISVPKAPDSSPISKDLSEHLPQKELISFRSQPIAGRTSKLDCRWVGKHGLQNQTELGYKS